MTRSKIAEKILAETPQEVRDKVHDYGVAQIAVSKYKAALRREIEKRVADCILIVEDQGMPNDQWLYSKAEVSAFQKVLLLLDTVEP